MTEKEEQQTESTALDSDHSADNTNKETVEVQSETVDNPDVGNSNENGNGTNGKDKDENHNEATDKEKDEDPVGGNVVQILINDIEMKESPDKFKSSADDNGDDDELKEDEAEGNTKLHRAAINFDLATVEKLVEDDRRIVNVSNKKYRTALHEMVLSYVSLDNFDQAYYHKRFLDILRFLLEKGLKVNETDFKSRTPLHYVVSHPENIDVIRALLAGGVRINYQDTTRQTALHLAVARGDMETVQALMDGGADPNLENSSGQTALHIAAKGKHHAPIISLLKRCGANINSMDRGKQTAMHIAAKMGRFENIEELIHAGAKPDLQDSSGQTPLHLAAAKDTTGRVVATLLESNVDIDLQDKIYMETPLHKTIRLKMLHNFKSIVEWRPDPNIRDLLGETSLHKAASLTDVWVWESLMKIGAKANITNHIGHTPHQKALRAKNNSALAVLRQHGIHDF